MILPDTNLISEVMKVDGNTAVRRWLGKQTLDTLFLAAPVQAELLLGTAVLPAGKRRAELERGLGRIIALWFGNRLVAFDHRSAVAYAEIVAGARARGRTISIIDGQIAGIAAAHGFSVATRDTAPFIAAGVHVIDPWQHDA